MTFSLTKKIVIPYALIGVLVLAMVITLQIMNARVGSLIGQEQDLARVRQAVHQVASEVKSGILTRSEASAIEVARIALSADETLSRLERAGADAKLLHSAFEDYFAGVVAINSVYLENRTEEGNKRLGKLREQERDIDTAVERAMEAVRAQHQRLETLGNSFQGLALLVLLAAIVLVSLFVRRQVVRPIREMAHTLEGIAQGKGDLTARITVKNQDEIGDIARAFNAMLGNLAKMIGDTVETARQVGTSAEHLASAIVQVRSSSIAQGESAATIAAAVEELTVSVNHVASLAHDSEKTATGAADVSEEGVKLAARSAEKAQIMESSGEHMAALATQLATESGKIHQLVAVIHEIADQTNLLALNAAIEAARAGEQGRGFAVVADEVRKLAERTNTEIATIRSIVDGMNQVVNGISSAIASNAGDEREESEIARKVSDIFAGVGHQAANTAERVRDIAYAMAEQATATTDIARNVETVAQMAEENSSAVDSVNNSAAQLKALAQQLQGLLAGFRY